MQIFNLARYERIAPFYDLLDLPFERRRYRALRPLLFRGMAGQLLDAGIGTGRNCEFYPPAAIVSGIDISPAMLARAQPWIAWAYGASFDRQTERRVPEAGLKLVESSHVVDDLLKLLTIRVPSRAPLLH